MGYLALYERSSDSKDPYMMIKRFASARDAPQHNILSMSVSPNNESIVCYLASAQQKQNQLVRFPLGNVDTLDDGDSHFEPLTPNGLHTDQIVAMDSCVQKPIVVTVATDRTLRSWNYLEMKCELSYTMTEEPTAVALHPAGLQVAVGFKDRVRMYNILWDTLRAFKELPLKHCKEVSYSHGGHMLACAIGISITVVDAYNFAPIATFQGHIQPVKQLVWSANDRVLCSAGTDGGIYGWDMLEHKRIESLCHVN